MTVGIAAICNNGANLICATDRLLSDSVSSLSGDVGANKMLFLDNWAFMLAGTLSNGDLILEELRLMAVPVRGKARLTRENVRRVLAKAYGSQWSNWLAERWLLPFDMDMTEFKKKGREYFGEERFSELSRFMDQDAANFNESVLVAGWGAAPHAANIFGMDRGGFTSHTLTGFAAIGSGGTVAMSTLLQLWQGRHMPTEDALYAVASAKFASESCVGVGEGTTICVVRKSNRADDVPVRPLQLSHIEELRRLWKRFGRPKIPSADILTQIANEVGAGTTVGAIRVMQRAVRRGARPRTSTPPDPPQGAAASER